MNGGAPVVAARLRRPLFYKYFAALFLAVVLALLIDGATEAWFGYREQRAAIGSRLHAEAIGAAGRIQAFLESARDQMQWTVQLPWTDDSADRHRFDALRLLRQVPAITELVLVDGAGVERLHLSRTQPDVVDAGTDRSADAAVVAAKANKVWYGPVTLHDNSEPFMAMAVAGNRGSAGVTIAVLNLKLIWDVITAIHIGEQGYAFALDGTGHLIAHPDISLVLRGGDDPKARALTALQAAAIASGRNAVAGTDAEDRAVLAAPARIEGPDWTAFAVEAAAEALAPVRAAMRRTAALAVAGAILAAVLALLFARRMLEPIRLLEQGAERIGAGTFDRPIQVATGDELERLANRFNQMAAELALSEERSERIARLKRFLAPQVAELVEQAGQQDLLDGHRADVVVIFCDLRGFTAFAAGAEPEEVMRVLGAYHAAIGAIIARYAATLTSFLGDGMMLLLNAPVRCPDDPALRAARMAIDMQEAMQVLLVDWRARGHALGFGIGMTRGEAMVGRIGYEGRLDYAAIGTVTNLASRLCSQAADRQILLDENAAATVAPTVALEPLGPQVLKGFERPVPIFAVSRVAADADAALSALGEQRQA